MLGEHRAEILDYFLAAACLKDAISLSVCGPFLKQYFLLDRRCECWDFIEAGRFMRGRFLEGLIFSLQSSSGEVNFGQRRRFMLFLQLAFAAYFREFRV
jgi:hypothetical protein